MSFHLSSVDSLFFFDLELLKRWVARLLKQSLIFEFFFAVTRDLLLVQEHVNSALLFVAELNVQRALRRLLANLVATLELAWIAARTLGAARQDLRLAPVARLTQTFIRIVVQCGAIHTIVAVVVQQAIGLRKIPQIFARSAFRAMRACVVVFILVLPSGAHTAHPVLRV